MLRYQLADWFACPRSRSHNKCRCSSSCGNGLHKTHSNRLVSTAIGGLKCFTMQTIELNILRYSMRDTLPMPVNCDSNWKNPRSKSPTCSGRTLSHGSPVCTAVIGGLNFVGVLSKSSWASRLASNKASSAYSETNERTKTYYSTQNERIQSIAGNGLRSYIEKLLQLCTEIRERQFRLLSVSLK